MAVNYSAETRGGDALREGGDRAAASRHTPVQALFLDRLGRLVGKVRLYRRYLISTDRRIQLLNRAILSTFRDCRELGLETEARAILAVTR